MFSVQISFDPARDGDVERFVLEVSTDSATPITFVLKVDVMIFVASSLLLILAIVFLSIAFLIVVVILIVCCYRRWRQRRDQEEQQNYKQHMLDHIKK